MLEMKSVILSKKKKKMCTIKLNSQFDKFAELETFEHINYFSVLVFFFFFFFFDNNHFDSFSTIFFLKTGVQVGGGVIVDSHIFSW